MTVDRVAKEVTAALSQISNTLTGCGHEEAARHIDSAVVQINELLHAKELSHNQSSGASRNG